MKQPRLFYFLPDQTVRKDILHLNVLQDFELLSSDDPKDWIATLEAGECDLAIVDIARCGEALLDQLLESPSINDVDFILISHGKPSSKLDTLMLRSGAYHFRQPVDVNEIREILVEAAESLVDSSESGKSVLTSDLDQFGLLVGSSRPMRKLYRTMRKVARSEANVLISGESGTGKELVARSIHSASDRRDKPYVALNCGALSPELVDSELFGHVKGAFTGAEKSHKGVFAQADGGTLFLDEITEMPLEHQVKLLRVLENEEYRPVGAEQSYRSNVRIIAATNRSPTEAIEEGKFREDLYFRLAEFPIGVPPLRDRGADISGLARHFLAYRNVAEKSNIGITDSALDKISRHFWPGNVRELKHTIERAFILADERIGLDELIIDPITRDDYPLGSNDHIPAGVPLEDLERQAIEKTLEENDGNKTSSAEQLGISVKTLYNKLEKYQQNSE